MTGSRSIGRSLYDRAADQPPRIDPRIARRWIDARREEGRRRLRFLIGFGSVVAVALILLAVVYSPLLKVRHVRITVNGALPAAQVRQLAGFGHQVLMIDVSPSQVAARLDAVPTLGGARVQRTWPGTVTIAVGVRQPVAVLAAGPAGSTTGPWAEVDPTGRVLATVAARPAGLPLLRGLGTVPTTGGWMAGSLGPAVPPGQGPEAEMDMRAGPVSATVPDQVDAALGALQSLPANLREAVQTVTSQRGGLTLVISPLGAGPISVLFGDGSQLQAKVVALETLVGQANLSGVTGLNLTVPSRPASTGRPAAVAGAAG